MAGVRNAAEGGGDGAYLIDGSQTCREVDVNCQSIGKESQIVSEPEKYKREAWEDATE